MMVHFTPPWSSPFRPLPSPSGALQEMPSTGWLQPIICTAESVIGGNLPSLDLYISRPLRLTVKIVADPSNHTHTHTFLLAGGWIHQGQNLTPYPFTSSSGLMRYITAHLFDNPLHVIAEHLHHTYCMFIFSYHSSTFPHCKELYIF